MAYIPVQRDAGRIMYESAMQRAGAIGQAISGLSEKMYQREEENKAFNAKLKSLESLLQTHSDKFGIKEDQLKQFLSVNPNESPKERYLRIGGFVEDSIKMSQVQKEQQAMKESAARAALAQTQADELRAEMGRRQAVARMLGLPTGEISAGGTAPVSVGAPSASAVAAGAPSVSAEAPSIPQEAPPAAPPRAPAEAPRSVQTAIRGLEAFTPDIAQQAQRESALKFLSSGQYSDPTLIAQRLVAEKRKQAAEERQLTLEEAKQQQEAFNESQKALPPGQRRAASVKESGTGGYYVLNIGIADLTPLEKKQLEAETKQEEFRLARINDRIKADIAAAQADRLIAPAVANLESIIREGVLDEGALATVKANILNFGKALNLPIDERKLSSTQQALAYFGQIVLPTFAATKGSISDKETELFRSWNPQLGLSNKANLELLGVLQKRINLNREMESLANKVDAQEISEKDYMNRRNKLIKAYDDSIPSANELRERSGVRDQPIAEGLGVGAGGEPAATTQPVTNASSMFNTLLQKAKKGQTQ
jgi:hypothetical protein